MRWFLGMVLTLAFVLLFLASFLLYRIDETVLEPDFYISHLREADVYSFLSEEGIPALVEQRVTREPVLPGGVVVTREEIADALRDVVSPSWIQRNAESAISQTLPFFTGERDDFRLELDLRRPTDQAIARLAVLADRKLEETYDALKPCSAGDLATLREGEFPSCRPPGVTYEELKVRVGIDLEAELRRQLSGQLPERVAFTRQDLDAAVGAFVPAGQVEQVDAFRRGVGLARKSLWVVPLVAGLFLVAGAVLASRGWAGRLRHASLAVLTAGGVLAVVALGAERWIRPDLVQFHSDLPPVVAEKLREVAADMASDFLAGVRPSVMPYVLGSMVGFAVSVFLQLLRPGRTGRI